MKKKFSLLGSERGQSLVELAISLVILLWLLSGAVEFGIALFQYVQLRDAAQEGALFGSIQPTDLPGIEARARASSDSPIDLAKLPVDGGPTIEIYIDDVLVQENGADQGVDISFTACESHALKVVAIYDHRIFMPFMPQILRQSEIELSAEVTDTILTPAPATGAPVGSCK